MEKVLSIIIPCYNVEKYIDRCVRSLVQQSIGIEKLELIFVNDASTDGTLKRLSRWEKRFPESILIIDCQQNHKQGGARNIGMLQAAADYIGFVDADDWVEPDMYQEMYEKAVQYQCDVVSIHSQREDEHGHVYHNQWKMPVGKADILVQKEQGKWPEGVQMPYGGVWSKIFRKCLILDHDVFFPEGLVYEDNFWSAIFSYYYTSFYVIPKVMYHYMVNWDSTILRPDSEAHKDRLKIEIMKLEELDRRNLLIPNYANVEFAFLKLYYINSLHLFFQRYTTQPYELLKHMQQEVKKRFPAYKANPHLGELNAVQKRLLDTVDMEMSENAWETLAEAYRKAYRKAY